MTREELIIKCLVLEDVIMRMGFLLDKNGIRPETAFSDFQKDSS